eukprot:86653-Amphidinium_carterae.1
MLLLSTSSNDLLGLSHVVRITSQEGSPLEDEAYRSAGDMDALCRSSSCHSGSHYTLRASHRWKCSKSCGLSCRIGKPYATLAPDRTSWQGSWSSRGGCQSALVEAQGRSRVASGADARAAGRAAQGTARYTRTHWHCRDYGQLFTNPTLSSANVAMAAQSILPPGPLARRGAAGSLLASSPNPAGVPPVARHVLHHHQGLLLLTKPCWPMLERHCLVHRLDPIREVVSPLQVL